MEKLISDTDTYKIKKMNVYCLEFVPSFTSLAFSNVFFFFFDLKNNTQVSAQLKVLPVPHVHERNGGRSCRQNRQSYRQRRHGGVVFGL